MIMKTKASKPADKNQSSSPFFSARNSAGFLNVQAKLNVGEPGDRYEVEADNIAEKVVNQSQTVSHGFFDSANSSQVQRNSIQTLQEKPLAESITPFVQKKEDEEEDRIQKQPLELIDEAMQMKSIEREEDKPVQKAGVGLLSESGGQAEVSSTIEKKLQNGSQSGAKMDPAIQSEMENGFGADFSQVSIHSDTEAVQMSQELGAQAFTHGKDVYFNKRKYNPSSNEGKHLLAHELTHTIQQTGMVPVNLQFTIGDGHDLQSARFSGDSVLEACLDGERILQQGSSGAAVSLIQQALIDAGFPLPNYGVDGIFGSETRTALQDFQRASSLVVDGKLGPGTMSALDALFSGGAPVLPPAIPVTPTPTTAPTVTTETISPAPDGTADTRTTVGVGERVRFTANTAGTWTVSDGHIIGINNGANMVWEAPAVASNSAITITTPGGTSTSLFTVIVPDALTMVVGRNDAIAVGTAGACMITDVTINPLNVNLGRLQWLEVPGPATNVSGYFNRYSGAQLAHHPNPKYLPFDDNNTNLTDHAALHEAPVPFSDGTFEWVIPNRYKLDGESDAQGRFFVNTVQSFFIFADGSVMITKAGELVYRTIN
jgi:peptidoglycan hydrolase-like protein with peptidoglycan-binding domain